MVESDPVKQAVSRSVIFAVGILCFHLSTYDDGDLNQNGNLSEIGEVALFKA